MSPEEARKTGGGLSGGRFHVDTGPLGGRREGPLGGRRKGPKRGRVEPNRDCLLHS